MHLNWIDIAFIIFIGNVPTAIHPRSLRNSHCRHCRGTSGKGERMTDEHDMISDLSHTGELSMLYRMSIADAITELRAENARLRALPSVGVTVKPLDWVRGIVDYAKPMPGMKYVACSTTPHGCWAWWLDGDNSTRTVERDEQHAKAAAQADYESRILSAIDVQPAPSLGNFALSETLQGVVENLQKAPRWDTATDRPAPSPDVAALVEALDKTTAHGQRETHSRVGHSLAEASWHVHLAGFACEADAEAFLRAALARKGGA